MLDCLGESVRRLRLAGQTIQGVPVSCSMNADKPKEMLMSRNKIRGNMFKMDDNPRIISGIGHFIRRTSLDEFPWFFNVPRGGSEIIGTTKKTLILHNVINFVSKPRKAVCLKNKMRGFLREEGSTICRSNLCTKLLYGVQCSTGR